MSLIDNKELWNKLDKEASKNKQAYYIDPYSRVRVLTTYFLKKRKFCCKSECRHCPWEYRGVQGVLGKLKSLKITGVSFVGMAAPCNPLILLGIIDSAIMGRDRGGRGPTQRNHQCFHLPLDKQEKALFLNKVLDKVFKMCQG